MPPCVAPFSVPTWPNMMPTSAAFCARPAAGGESCAASYFLDRQVALVGIRDKLCGAPSHRKRAGAGGESPCGIRRQGTFCNL